MLGSMRSVSTVFNKSHELPWACAPVANNAHVPTTSVIAQRYAKNLERAQAVLARLAWPGKTNWLPAGQ